MSTKTKKKTNKKQYSVDQKVRYHHRRINGYEKATDNQVVYSGAWLDGYYDERAKNNLSAVKSEISRRRRDKIPFSQYDVNLVGYRNGLSSKLKKEERKKYLNSL